MSLCSPKVPTPADPADAAVGGIAEDLTLSPFNYLINAAAQMGKKVTIDGKTYDFTGVGQADTAATVSDQMAQTLLELQKTKSPELIKQRLEELKAADPKGYAARQELFDQIMAEANKNPDQPLSVETSQRIQDELAKGAGFNDEKQKREVQDAARGQQVAKGIYRGNTATSDEAKQVVNAGETLKSQRQQDALALLQSGSTPEDIAYRKMEQTLANLASFANGSTPESQFGQVSAASAGPVTATGSGVNTNLFNAGAAGTGVNNALSAWNTATGYQNSQANPWLTMASTGFNTVGALKNINPNWFGGTA